jgi:hypothetical protein
MLIIDSSGFDPQFGSLGIGLVHGQHAPRPSRAPSR